MKTATRFSTLPALLALSFLLLPLSLQAQAGQGGQRGMMGGGGMMGGAMLEQLLASPAQVALEHRAELGLSQEQATRLEAMHRAFDEEHEEHLDLLRERLAELAALREGGQGQRQGMRQGGAMQGQGRAMQGQGGAMSGAMAEMQEAMQALREARQAQLRTMGDFLTANQLRELRERMGPMGMAGPGGPGGGMVR